MDKRIKQLIDENIFHSDKLDYDIRQHKGYDESSITIIFNVNHKKLWKSSGYYDPKYYDLIIGLDNGDFDSSFEDFLPMIGYNFDYYTVRYNPIKTSDDAYYRLFNALDDLNISYEYYFPKESPWLFTEWNSSESINIDDLYYTLEEEYDLDMDDIVFTQS